MTAIGNQLFPDFKRRLKSYNTKELKARYFDWVHYWLAEYRRDVVDLTQFIDHDTAAALRGSTIPHQTAAIRPFLASPWFMLLRRQFGAEYMWASRAFWMFLMPVLLIEVFPIPAYHPVMLFFVLISALAWWHSVETYNLWHTPTSMHDRGISSFGPSHGWGEVAWVVRILIEPIIAFLFAGTLMSFLTPILLDSWYAFPIMLYLFLGPFAVLHLNWCDLKDEIAIEDYQRRERLRERMTQQVQDHQQRQLEGSREATAPLAVSPSLDARPTPPSSDLRLLEKVFKYRTRKGWPPEGVLNNLSKLGYSVYEIALAAKESNQILRHNQQATDAPNPATRRTPTKKLPTAEDIEQMASEEMEAHTLAEFETLMTQHGLSGDDIIALAIPWLRSSGHWKSLIQSGTTDDEIIQTLSDIIDKARKVSEQESLERSAQDLPPELKAMLNLGDAVDKDGSQSIVRDQNPSASKRPTVAKD